MRATWLLVAMLGCKDKSEPKPNVQSDDPAVTAAGSAPKLEIERDRFGHIPGGSTPSSTRRGSSGSARRC